MAPMLSKPYFIVACILFSFLFLTVCRTINGLEYENENLDEFAADHFSFEGAGQQHQGEDEYGYETSGESENWSELYDSADEDIPLGYDIEGKEKDIVSRFVDWLKENAATLGKERKSKIKVVSTEPISAVASPAVGVVSRDYGLQAENDISAGETLFSCPQSFIISPKRVASDILPAQPVSSAALLATWLLQEKIRGESSPWFPFIQALPRYVSLPVFWAAELLDQLESPEINSEVSAMHNSWRKDFLSLAEAGYLKAAAEPDFHWAMSVITTRCIDLNQFVSIGEIAEELGDVTCVIIPFVDFINHWYESSVAIQITEQPPALRLIAAYQIPKDTPIFITYSNGTGDQFLLRYGFIPDYNSFDSLVIFPHLSELAAYYLALTKEEGKKAPEGSVITEAVAMDAAKQGLKKLALVKGTNVTETGLWLGVDGKLDLRLMAAASAMCLAREGNGNIPDIELDEVVTRLAMVDGDLSQLLCQLEGIKNEIANSRALMAIVCSVNLVVDMAGDKLEAHKSSFEEDLEALSHLMHYDLTLTEDEKLQRTILSFRVGQKKILMDTKDIYEDGCPMDAGIEGDVEQQMEDEEWGGEDSGIAVGTLMQEKAEDEVEEKTEL